jgi:hypothetical protein
MSELKKRVSWKPVDGPSIESGDDVITPVAHCLTLRFPFVGFAWSRPHSLRVKRGDESHEVPIVDVTRLAQLAIYGAGICLASILWLINRRRY